ncbi:MAG: hypothetical protein AAFO75_14245 [Pseudomonadota bacterium]
MTNDHGRKPDAGLDQNQPDSGEVPKLFWFLGLHGGIGIAVGIIFVSTLILFNVASIHDLLSASDEPYLPLFLFYFTTALTFGSLNIAIAVMSMPWKKTR